jgi:hypothetical protein
MKEQYQIYHINWNGIEIEIRYCPDWSQALQEGHGITMAHLEVETISPARAALPITETGYKSHFTNADVIIAAGGAVKFLRDALDCAAQSKDWKRLDAESRQGVLF